MTLQTVTAFAETAWQNRNNQNSDSMNKLAKLVWG